MPDKEESLVVLAGYNQGWIDALKKIISAATEELEEKLKEIKDANSRQE